jgi:HEAT repeat protein
MGDLAVGIGFDGGKFFADFCHSPLLARGEGRVINEQSMRGLAAEVRERGLARLIAELADAVRDEDFGLRGRQRGDHSAREVVAEAPILDKAQGPTARRILQQHVSALLP